MYSIPVLTPVLSKLAAFLFIKGKALVKGIVAIASLLIAILVVGAYVFVPIIAPALQKIGQLLTGSKTAVKAFLTVLKLCI